MSVRLRPVLAVAICGALAAGSGIAAAAPKPVCNLLTDAKGDAGATTAASAGPSDPALDIVSGDIASDKNKITGVFRLSEAATSAATGPNGFRLLMLFDDPASEGEIYLFATSSRAGMAYGFGKDDPVAGLDDLGGGTGVVDKAKNEIRVSIKLSDFRAAINLKPGMKITGLNAVSSRDFVAVVTFADRASDGKDYVAGSPSCVKVGK